MSYRNVVLCNKLSAWNYDPEKMHTASEQIDQLFDGVSTGLFLVDFSMSLEKQCLIARVLFKENLNKDHSSQALKVLTREIAGVLSDIYCGGNDDCVLINYVESGALLEIHQNPDYDDE